MRTPILLFVLAASLMGCPPPKEAPSPNPVPDSELCGPMCKHIGPKTAENPKGLGCPEGEPLYDSDRPGPVDVPNLDCETWCKEQQAKGVFINPRCVMQVKTCDEIEPARQKVCN
jgi:hypothetical protein